MLLTSSIESQLIAVRLGAQGTNSETETSVCSKRITAWQALACLIFWYGGTAVSCKAHIWQLYSLQQVKCSCKLQVVTLDDVIVWSSCNHVCSVTCDSNYRVKPLVFRNILCAAALCLLEKSLLAYCYVPVCHLLKPGVLSGGLRVEQQQQPAGDDVRRGLLLLVAIDPPIRRIIWINLRIPNTAPTKIP
jgi:hypothetical protein